MPRHSLIERAQNASTDNLPVFYKYRFTYNDNTNKSEQITKANQLFAEIKELYSLDGRLTMGIEHYTKGMVAARPHVHIHFVSKVSADSIRHHLRTKFEMVGRVQHCKAEVLVDESKFWRYPVKQQKGETFVFKRCSGFEDTVFDNMVAVAYDCWKQSAEVAQRREEAREERSSRDRLFAYLKTQEFTDMRGCMIAAFRYYAEYEANFNITSVRGYVHIYCMQTGIISVEEMVDRYAM